MLYVKRDIKYALEAVRQLDLPLDNPWRCDLHFLIVVEKGQKLPNPHDHEFKLGIENLGNKETYEEVEAIMKGESEPSKVATQAFLASQPKLLEVLAYYSSYRPPRAIVSKECTNFKAF